MTAPSRLCALIGALALGLVAGCAAKDAQTAAPASQDATAEPSGGADMGRELERAVTIEEMEAELGSLEAQLGSLVGGDCGGETAAEEGDAGQAVGGAPADARANTVQDRCSTICNVAEAICGLETSICSMAAEHEGEERYEASCERAQTDCAQASTACTDCS